MDSIQNGRLVHPTLDLPVMGNPPVIPGRIFRAVRLEGNGQYLDLGQHSGTCFGNLRLCRHGYTTSMWVNFKRFENDMYYYSNGNGVKMYHRNGNLHVVMEIDGKQWHVQAPGLSTNTWYFIEFSWHPEKGLQMYVNNRLAAQMTAPTRVTSRPVSDARHVYVGRANSGDTTGRFRYADVTVDELETWYSDRDTLLAFGHILRGTKDA